MSSFLNFLERVPSMDVCKYIFMVDIRIVFLLAESSPRVISLFESEKYDHIWPYLYGKLFLSDSSRPLVPTFKQLVARTKVIICANIVGKWFMLHLPEDTKLVFSVTFGEEAEPAYVLTDKRLIMWDPPLHDTKEIEFKDKEVEWRFYRQTKVGYALVLLHGYYRLWLFEDVHPENNAPLQIEYPLPANLIDVFVFEGPSDNKLQFYYADDNGLTRVDYNTNLQSYETLVLWPETNIKHFLKREKEELLCCTFEGDIYRLELSESCVKPRKLFNTSFEGLKWLDTPVGFEKERYDAVKTLWMDYMNFEEHEISIFNRIYDWGYRFVQVEFTADGWCHVLSSRWHNPRTLQAHEETTVN